MDLIRLFRRLAFAQVMLGILASCLAQRNPGLLLIAGTLSALSWYVVEGPGGWAVPKWLIMLGALVATAYLGFEVYATVGQNLIVTIAHYTMWLQIMLLYSKMGNREHAQILVLSLLQMVSASMISVSMIFGMLMAAYCVLVLFTVLLFQLKMASDLVRQYNLQAAGPVGLPVGWDLQPKAVVGRGHRWQFCVTAIITGGLCALIGVVVFLLFPRSKAADMHLSFTAPLVQNKIGFTSTISLRSTSLAGGSHEPVMNVKLAHNRRTQDMENESWLLRGAVLNRYNPLTLTWSYQYGGMAAHDVAIDLPAEGKVLLDLPDSAPIIDAHITLLEASGRYLFTLDLPLAMISSANVDKLMFDPRSHQLTVAEAHPGPLVYHLRSLAQLPRGFDLLGAYAAHMTIKGDSKDARRQHNGRSWPIQPHRVRRLAMQLVQQAGLRRDPHTLYDENDASIGRVLETYLSRSNKFRYTLDLPQVVKGKDPIIEFLFTHRKGHCELFASALTAMARSIGMRARMVTGYRSGEYNRIGGYYVVRQINAHAWSEVELSPGVWQTFDPSPPAAVDGEQKAGRNWLTPLRELYEHLEFLWAQSVVAYNFEGRRAIIRSVKKTVTDLGSDRSQWWTNAVTSIKNLYDLWWLDRFTQIMASAIMFFILVGLITLLRLLIVRRRRLVALHLTALPRQQRRILARQLRFYLTMLDMLERDGHVRSSWQSPFGFAEELVAQHPARLEPVVALTEMFYEIRFGYRRLNDRRRAIIRRHIRNLEHSLRQKVQEKTT